MTTAHATTSAASCFLAAVTAAATAALPGCYNADALTQAKINEAARMRLEDVDLGTFRITLPRQHDSHTGGVVQFHAFGQVANRDLKKVKKAFERDQAEVRNGMLIAIRKLEASDFEEPHLETLRAAIAEVVNESLEDQPFKSIGFYKLRFNVL